MEYSVPKAIRFLVFFTVLFAVLQFAIVQVDLFSLESALAQLVGDLLQAPVRGNEVFVSTGIFRVNNQCTGLLSGAVLAAVVFSLQKPTLAKKALLVLGGGFILFLLNIPRLVLVVWSGKEFGAPVAEIVHTGTWFLTTAFILIVWYWFTRKWVSQTFEDLL